MNRRLFLLAGTGLCGLAACTFGPGTATLDVNRIAVDGQAIISVLTNVLAIPAVAALTGGSSAAIALGLAGANAALAQLNQLTGGSVTVTVDTSKVQTIITSLLDDASKVLALVQQMTMQLTGVVAQEARTYVSAAQTLIPIVAAAASVLTTVSARQAAVPMNERQALAVAARPAL